MVSGASQVRFWGKFYGVKKDFWVVEGVLNRVEEPQKDSIVEKRGDGVNRLVYWVTDDVLEDWV